MLQSIRVLIISIMVSGFMFADVFMTELTDPQNSSDAGRYVELYNNGASDVDLSTWTVQRWTNGNADPTNSSIVALTGTISAGGFYIICNSADKFNATFSGMDGTCDLDIGTGGFADSNGDDNMALLNNGEIVDMFGVAGEDGTGTWHEFEDGRAERVSDAVSGCVTDCETEWDIDNDSGGGDGPQYAPEGFDPGDWIGAADNGGDCASGVYDCAGVCDGSSVEDCFGVCDGNGVSEGVDCDGAYIVELTAMDFTPENLSISLGETVKWVWVAGYHNVNGSLDAYPNNPEGFESEFGSEGFTYSYTFNTAGTYDYHCDPHLGMGMVGTVSVIDTTPSNLFFSEASEGSSNNKYLEIYNGEDTDVDLSGYSLSSCSNGCDAVGEWDYADNVTFEAGTTLASGDVYVVCHGSASDEIQAECDQTFTYLSNGDDVFALTQVGTGTVLDVIGLVGDDPGSGWDVAGVSNATKDHTLVRKATVMTGNPLWLDNTETGEAGSAGTNEDDSEWIVFDQNTWDYVGFHPHDFSSDVMGCMDETACNYNADATVDDGSCASLDCAGECGGAAVCEVAVTFSVDMSIDGSTSVDFRVSTVGGSYNPSDWFAMDDSDGDMVYTYTMMLETGVEYGYNFNNGGYESGSGLTGCAGGSYGNDRYVTPGDADMILDTVCFGSCEACPAIVEGCTDSTATNYNADATVDDGSCEYEAVEYANLFISEAAEGSSNNKYIEIYNASDDTVDLSGYAYPTVGNAPTVPGEYEYWNTFTEGASVAPGDVYVICHGSSDEFILAECDEFYTYLSNGDDGLCLVGGSEGNFDILDCFGDWNGDPGSGWDVAGVAAATKDHTLVRKASVITGNDGLWEFSAGESEDDSEWVVLEQNTWTYLGSHPHSFESADVEGCMDMNATNYDADATVQSFNEYGTSTCTYSSCADIPTETGCLWEDGTSAMWWEGWWNCTDAGGQVCGLAEVVFELNLPDTDDLQGNPHVNGTYNGWCGSCYNAMQDIDGDGTWTHVQYFSEGETHDYKFTMDGWSNQEDLTGLEDCAVEADGYWNRQFTAGPPNSSQTLTNCWGTCEAECPVAPECGDGVCDENEDCSSCSTDCGACPEFAVAFDIDGLEDCGQVNITGTWDNWSGWGVNPADHPEYTISLAPGDYEYTILCVNTVGEWWNDVWGNSTQYFAPTGCDWNPDDEYANYGFTVADADMTVSMCAGTCDEVCAEEPVCSYDGDANGDGIVNVTDIVLIVGLIIGDGDANDIACSSDVNEDGTVNVTDIVWIVGTIINGSGSNSNSSIATDAVINIAGNKLSVDGINGDISGVQLVLSHDSDFDIILENTNASNFEFSGKKQIDKNTTEFFIVKDDLNAIATTMGDYSILSAIVVTGKGQGAQEIASTVVDLPESFELKSAYPNPFNPITTLELAVPETGYISVKVYNLVGQEVVTLVNGVVNATDAYTFQWNASNVSSGIYLVRAEGFGSIQTQKLMLLK